MSSYVRHCGAQTVARPVTYYAAKENNYCAIDLEAYFDLSFVLSSNIACV